MKIYLLFHVLHFTQDRWFAQVLQEALIKAEGLVRGTSPKETVAGEALRTVESQVGRALGPLPASPEKLPCVSVLYIGLSWKILFGEKFPR